MITASPLPHYDLVFCDVSYLHGGQEHLSTFSPKGGKNLHIEINWAKIKLKKEDLLDLGNIANISKPGLVGDLEMLISRSGTKQEPLCCGLSSKTHSIYKVLAIQGERIRELRPRTAGSSILADIAERFFKVIPSDATLVFTFKPQFEIARA